MTNRITLPMPPGHGRNGKSPDRPKGPPAIRGAPVRAVPEAFLVEAAGRVDMNLAAHAEADDPVGLDGLLYCPVECGSHRKKPYVLAYRMVRRPRYRKPVQTQTVGPGFLVRHAGQEYVLANPVALVAAGE